jgi:hypothetical protein
MSKDDSNLSADMLKRRAAIAGDGEELEDDALEIENYEPLPEQTSKEKEKRVDREEVSSPTKGVPPTPSISIMEALARRMDNFKGSPVPKKQSKELDGEDGWEDEEPEELRPVVREEAPVKKEPGKINVNSGLFDKVAGLFGDSPKKEQPKVGKLNPEAIKALANAKAEDLRRAAEREELPRESRVSVTSAELQKSSDIPIPPAPPPPPILEATKEPRVSVSSVESVKGPDIPIPPSPPPAPALKETRTTVAMDESPIPPVEKRKTSVSEIPIAKGNKDLGIVIKDLEQLQQEVSGKIGPNQRTRRTH